MHQEKQLLQYIHKQWLQEEKVDMSLTQQLQNNTSHPLETSSDNKKTVEHSSPRNSNAPVTTAGLMHVDGPDWILFTHIQYDWQLFCANQYGYNYLWAPHEEPNPGIKTPRSHYKILSKLTEIYWRWLSTTGSYSVQSSVAKTTRGLHIKSRTLELKPRVHTIKLYRNWLKLLEMSQYNWQILCAK